MFLGGGKKKPLKANKGSGASDKGDMKQLKKEEVKKPAVKTQQKQKLSVLIEESQGRKAIENMKAITIQGLARAVGVKTSVANSYIKSLETRGLVRNIGGYSGHRVYQLIKS